MIKKTLFYSFFLFTLSGIAQDEQQAIASLLDKWHLAAAEAQFEPYFDAMTAEAVFIGTDATENWSRDEFEIFAKPYFDRGKAWAFKSVERNIYLDDSGDFGWFDELLDTQMYLCRGSGVVLKIDGHWKIAHYVLSIAVPNEHVDALIALKKEKDSLLLKKLKLKN